MNVFLLQGNLGYDGTDELGIFTSLDNAGLRVEECIKLKTEYFSYCITEVPVDSPFIVINHWSIDGYLTTKKIRSWQTIKAGLESKACEATA